MLIEHNLIDEYRLITVPVVLGRGKRLFSEGTKPAQAAPVQRRLNRGSPRLNAPAENDP
jgi:dihydrofolate reductase